MSKKRYQYYTDFLTDFNGQRHIFIICACSVELSKNSELYKQLGISKKVSLGVAICNPVDAFDESIGQLLASSRAESGDIVMYANKKGYINTKVINALLMQEAKCIKKEIYKYLTENAKLFKIISNYIK